MARGARVSPSSAPALPKVQFVKVEDEVSTQPSGVHDLQARSYGYNDFSEFQRPDHYIRHIEPLEIDLARQVEYDMDEQDLEWLDALNADRKKEHLDKVSYEVFEIIMDRLEKEWFDLTKNLPKTDFAMPSEDSTCAVCDDPEGENVNAIVFCDGCNLAVHQDCYGVPYIPEGQWLCRKCSVSPETPVSCILCPNEGGAFKQTVHGEWVHLLCAIWIPETRVENETLMEPITGVEKISKQRWKLRCSICDIREGACIQCAKSSCFLAFHATCARKEKLLLPMKNTQGSEPLTLTCYCERHLPKEQQEARELALAAHHSDGTASPSRGGANSKSARAYAKTYSTGPPLVPALIVNRLLQYITKVVLRKKTDFVYMVCRYWSLKREARRGAPLLKRLHLEPWSGTTMNSMGKDADVEDQKLKLEALKKLKQDLERLKELALLTRKRESRKLRQARLIHETLRVFLFPHEKELRSAFDRITSLDRQEYFKNPVSAAEVPDYHHIVKNPMCWSQIEEKLTTHQYWDLQAFKDDVTLVLGNAILYNKPGTAFYKTAQRLKGQSVPILDSLDSLIINHDANPHDGPSQDYTNNRNQENQENEEPLGNLEPHISALRQLFNAGDLQEELDMLVSDAPIKLLLKHELAISKPLPPPPPPPPPKPPRPKRDRQAEQAKRRKTLAERDQAAQVALAAEVEALRLNPTTRVRQTRGSKAAAVVVATSQSEAEKTPTTAQDHSAGSLPPSVPSTPVLPPPKTPQSPWPLSSATDTKQDQASWPPQLEAEAGPSTSDTTELPPPSTTKKTAPRKRGSWVSSYPLEAPPLIETVDNIDYFKLFDKGWILPSDQKRRRPVSITTSGPPPKKKGKLIDTTTPSSEVFGMVSTPSGSRQTAELVETGDKPSDAMEVDDTASLPPPPSSSILSAITVDTSSSFPGAEPSENTSPTKTPSGLALLPSQNIVHGPNGTVIIEELDTPETRRQKNAARKARLALTRSSGQIAPPSGQPRQPSSAMEGETGDSQVKVVSEKEKKERGDGESDLSSLSDAESASGKGKGKAMSKDLSVILATPVKSLKKKRRDRGKDYQPAIGTISLEEGKKLDGGTLVWAKTSTFPWWPAVIYEANDPLVPANVVTKTQELESRSKGLIHIVNFYDKQKSWQYLPLHLLRYLGEVKELDDEMLSNRQKWKNQQQRNECVEAFTNAMAEMDLGSNATSPRTTTGAEADTEADTEEPEREASMEPDAGTQDEDMEADEEGEGGEEGEENDDNRSKTTDAMLLELLDY